MGSPVVGGEGDAPEFWGGFQEIDADFGLAFSGRSDVDDADKLFFKRFDVADEDFLVERDAHGEEKQGAVGADVDGKCVFGLVPIVSAASDDEDGEAEKDALAPAAIGNRGVVGGRGGHGGDGLGIVLEKKAGRSRGGRYYCARGGKRWSRRRESNPHGAKLRQILSLLRLPVPPLRENL